MPLSFTGKLISLCAAAGFLAAAPVASAATDPLIEGAKQCTHYLPRYEREYAIPTHLLSAIASTESGRYHEGLKIKLPWPWTINVEGKGYFFNTKEDAIMAVRKLQMRGIQSIDVGCMQVNLMHHPHAFRSLEEAFEPEYNVAYAAGFLRGLYQENGSWKQAAANYHSRTPARGNQYVGLVYDSWYKIVDKLRAAKLQTPDYAAMAEPAPVQEPQRLPEQVGRVIAAHTTPHMNSISVSQSRPRDSGLIVVQPDTRVPPSVASRSISVAQAPAQPKAPVTQPVEKLQPVAATAAIEPAKPITVAAASRLYAEPAPADTTSHIIRITDQPDDSVRKGPNFIFND